MQARTLIALALAALLGAGLLAPAPARAQGLTFPETGYSVSGRFLEYWQQNGGLPVFGYPLTAERQEEGRTVQYFERARFELHPDNQRPYDVLLGLLGVRALERQGINWMDQPTSDGPRTGCQYFPETRQNVCNQQTGAGFLNYWRANGLEFDGRPGTSYAESLALFGYPITTAYEDIGEDGRTYQVQWFERARFEWHPDNPQQYRVLLGRLGAALLAEQGGQPPTVSEVQLALIALGDAGQSGERIGCDDSVVLVTVPVEPTPAPLTAAIRQLLAIEDQYYGQSGLYNALYNSDLRLDRAVIEQGRATLELSGELRLGGVCDDPRVEAQITRTALQFATVDAVTVTLNGRPLDEVLSAR
ncbi:MAG TPA: GerMN domain-containing protein [Chloroflexaceae bacterium]|nr:GerMN domain-containing protein [Chloroflexaceae bacterium]